MHCLIVARREHGESRWGGAILVFFAAHFRAAKLRADGGVNVPHVFQSVGHFGRHHGAIIALYTREMYPEQTFWHFGLLQRGRGQGSCFGTSFKFAFAAVKKLPLPSVQDRVVHVQVHRGISMSHRRRRVSVGRIQQHIVLLKPAHSKTFSALQATKGVLHFCPNFHAIFRHVGPPWCLQFVKVYPCNL